MANAAAVYDKLCRRIQATESQLKDTEEIHVMCYIHATDWPVHVEAVGHDGDELIILYGTQGHDHHPCEVLLSPQSIHIIIESDTIQGKRTRQRIAFKGQV